MKEYIKYLPILLIVLWMIVIFIFSNMNTNESNEKSEGIISKAIEGTVSATNEAGITDSYPDENKIKEVSKKLNIPFRKCLHATEYFILVIFAIYVLKIWHISDRKVYLIAILICFLYACTDEFHQQFVKGRSASFVDVIIDTLGASIGACLHKILCKFREKT